MPLSKKIKTKSKSMKKNKIKVSMNKSKKTNPNKKKGEVRRKKPRRKRRRKQRGGADTVKVNRRDCNRKCVLEEFEKHLSQQTVNLAEIVDIEKKTDIANEQKKKILEKKKTQIQQKNELIQRYKTVLYDILKLSLDDLKKKIKEILEREIPLQFDERKKKKKKFKIKPVKNNLGLKEFHIIEEKENEVNQQEIKYEVTICKLGPFKKVKHNRLQIIYQNLELEGETSYIKLSNTNLDLDIDFNDDLTEKGLFWLIKFLLILTDNFKDCECLFDIKGEIHSLSVLISKLEEKIHRDFYPGTYHFIEGRAKLAVKSGY